MNFDFKCVISGKLEIFKWLCVISARFKTLSVISCGFCQDLFIDLFIFINAWQAS